MKIIVPLMLLCIGISAESQTAHRDAPSCPSRLTLEIIQQDGKSVYRMQQASYLGYPLDVVGRLVNRCPALKRIDIIVDSGSRFDDVDTAVNGAGKNQIDQVLIFLKAKDGHLYPVTIGEKSVNIGEN
jgi:hypothetical protein